ncbi:hypothetical protein OG496_11440 [Streptomyces sp. NBC_00988]|nr:hypothetical protein OG496_11440 [Streptomyces sp. NBC_00988]
MSQQADGIRGSDGTTGHLITGLTYAPNHTVVVTPQSTVVWALT